jgi:hypothetical protein
MACYGDSFTLTNDLTFSLVHKQITENGLIFSDLSSYDYYCYHGCHGSLCDGKKYRSCDLIKH